MTILITGGSGTVGREIMKHLDPETIICLEHNTKIQTKKSIQGDITKKNLGIKNLKILEEITRIIHCAASTRFDMEIDEIRKINVDGTRNLLELAKSCKNLKKISLMSTVYVSGKRTGLIKEDELEHDSGFVNTYEQSKYESELLAKKYDLPISIYRLSTIVGDSKTGKVTNYTAPHHALRMIYLGLSSLIPGTEDYVVDLIATDSTGKILAKRIMDEETGRTHQIAATAKNAYILKEMIDKSYEYIQDTNPNWAARKYPKPVITDQKTFELFIDSIEKTGNMLFANVMKALKHFSHQLSYPKEFETKDIEMPHIDTYYDKVVKHCIKTGWGRNERTG